jgi:hypothetical protein
MSISQNFFGINLLTLFCKLEHFIAMQQNCLFIKWSSLIKIGVNWLQKTFTRSAQGWNGQPMKQALLWLLISIAIAHE